MVCCLTPCTGNNKVQASQDFHLSLGISQGAQVSRTAPTTETLHQQFGRHKYRSLHMLDSRHSTWTSPPGALLSCYIWIPAQTDWQLVDHSMFRAMVSKSASVLITLRHLYSICLLVCLRTYISIFLYCDHLHTGNYVHGCTCAFSTYTYIYIYIYI